MTLLPKLVLPLAPSELGVDRVNDAKQAAGSGSGGVADAPMGFGAVRMAVGSTPLGGLGAGAARVLLSPPDVGERERLALLEAFDSNWISTVGPAIRRFEGEMAERLGRHCVALSSGTAALHLALRLAGVEAGDTVICQSFTFVATANPILYERATPYFVDSEPRTWNLDADLLEEAIRRLERKGKRPKAVVAVHLYGVPAEIGRIAGVCARYGVALIEDAAEALGAEVDGCQWGRTGRRRPFPSTGTRSSPRRGAGCWR